MATSSSFPFPRKRNRCALSVFILFIFFLFFLGRKQEIPVYRELTSQETPVTIPSPLRSTEKFGDIAEPALSALDPADNADSDNGDLMNNNDVAEVDTASKFDEKETGPVVSSSDPESEENSGETGGEPVASDDKSDVPISSKSDLDDDTNGGEQVDETILSDAEESEGFVDNAMAEKWRNCDFYQGTWVRDEGYPLYQAGSCPYIDEAFECTNNGRPDSQYLKWRWKPDGCDLPRFNATDFLVRLRGKRLMLVGDSMNRNQFESLLCLLREGLSNKSRMYEVHGYKITKGRGYFVFKIEDYNCTVEFVRSHFLVREGVRINAQGNSNPTLSIDRIDKTARRWQRADILVFNTGHWWAHGKTSRGKNYYKEGNYLYPKLAAMEAYRKAIETWATWVKKNLPKKLVFYRGYSSAHFRGGDWDSGGSCNGETEPAKSGPILDSYPPKMTIVEEVLRETRAPVLLLNVTRLTNFRKDGHPSIYRRNVTSGKRVSTRRQDCSHWCLPGVPDAWNELIYTTLIAR